MTTITIQELTEEIRKYLSIAAAELPAMGVISNGDTMRSHEWSKAMKKRKETGHPVTGDVTTEEAAKLLFEVTKMRR